MRHPADICNDRQNRWTPRESTESKLPVRRTTQQEHFGHKDGIQDAACSGVQQANVLRQMSNCFFAANAFLLTGVLVHFRRIRGIHGAAKSIP